MVRYKGYQVEIGKIQPELFDVGTTIDQTFQLVDRVPMSDNVLVIAPMIENVNVQDAKRLSVSTYQIHIWILRMGRRNVKNLQALR